MIQLFLIAVRLAFVSGERAYIFTSNQRCEAVLLTGGIYRRKEKVCQGIAIYCLTDIFIMIIKFYFADYIFIGSAEFRAKNLSV